MIKRNYFLEFFGYRYYANHNTKEIHRIDSSDVRCRFSLMTHKERITKRKLKKLLANGYNGCRWCMKEYDLG